MDRSAFFTVAAVVMTASLACGNSTSSLVSPSPAPSAATDRLFADDFEAGTLDAWQDGVNPALHRIVTDPAAAQSGSKYLAVTFPPGRDGGWLTRFLMPGDDSLYVSSYVRFPAGWQGGTKLVALYGSRMDNQWS